MTVSGVNNIIDALNKVFCYLCRVDQLLLEVSGVL